MNEGMECLLCSLGVVLEGVLCSFLTCLSERLTFLMPDLKMLVDTSRTSESGTFYGRSFILIFDSIEFDFNHHMPRATF